MLKEKRACNECGEEWTDSGEITCPFCKSDDTYIVEEIDDEPARLTDLEQQALDYFDLEYAKSDEPGAGWFAYTKYTDPGKNNYPGSSCECLEDVVKWFDEATGLKGLEHFPG